MIQEFVELWDKNKDKLRDYISKTNQSEYDTYENLVKILIEKVLHDIGLDTEKMVVIDHGHYQGTKLFIIPNSMYQPEFSDYYSTYAEYGSCSVCDAMDSISPNHRNIPDEVQVKKYMLLSLHLLQRFVKFKDLE